jgi:glycosyltransferase involved in cell wall biosynthesis
MVAGVARKSTKEEEATMNKVRVVMLAPLPPPAGGMATVALNLMNSRLARDCELTVVDTAKRTPEGRGQLRGFLYQLRLLMGIASAVRRTRAQIVHIHTCSGFTFWRDSIHLILARMMRRQAVWHIHGAQFDTFVNNFSCIEKMAYRAVLGMAGVVIVLSDDWLARLQSSAPRARWRALPNGTPLQVGVRSRFNDKPVFLFLANLEPRKGAGDLIQAFALAKKRVYTGMLEVVGGETLPGQKTELENLASDLKCLSEIRFRGLLQGVEKDRTLAQADCFVLPSYAEGLPMAMLEAMACGLPVIATTVGGIPEVITDGKEGFLVAPGDIGALADRMIKLARDISLRQLMGQNALDRVVREFSLDKMCDRILDIYQDVLGDPHERDSHDLTHTPSTGDD